MLDLKKLEEKLDKALANETCESLTNWLLEKRLHDFLHSLGDGTFADIPLTNNAHTSSVMVAQKVQINISQENSNYSQEFSNAA